jgi:hypothetical protein
VPRGPQKAPGPSQSAPRRVGLRGRTPEANWRLSAWKPRLPPCGSGTSRSFLAYCEHRMTTPERWSEGFQQADAIQPRQIGRGLQAQLERQHALLRESQTVFDQSVAAA